MSLPFTNIKDIDLEILQKLEDHELYDICLVNKYAAKLCNDENFWRNRFIKNFGLDILNGKPSEMTWKEYYIELSNYEELEGYDKLYYISPRAKTFFTNADFGDYLDLPLNYNLIEKAGVSSKNNLTELFEIYKNNFPETDFNNIFDVEYPNLPDVDKQKLDKINDFKLLSRILEKPLRTNTLLYNKMYNIYKKERQILKIILRDRMHD